MEVKKLGGEIQWETEVLKIHENEHNVEVEYKNKNENEKSITSKYLIGADGAHSITRHQINIPFDGSPYAMNLWACDLPIYDIDLPNLDCQSYGFISRKTGALIIPLPKEHLFRIIIGENNPCVNNSINNEVKNEPVSFFQDILLRHRPSSKNWKFGEPVWNNHFKIHCRLAEHYRSQKYGRCFLAGDAAHLYSPFGGQGMNIGVQDAINLSWRLSYVINEKAPISILTPYETERKFTSKSALFLADFSTKIIGTQYQIIIWIRNLIIFPIVKNSMFVQRRTVAQFQGLNFYCTSNSSAVENIIGGNKYWQKFTCLVRGGSRLPNLKISYSNPPITSRLHDIFANGRFHFILFISKIKKPNELLSYVKFIEEIALCYKDCFDISIIVSEPKEEILKLFDQVSTSNINILYDPTHKIQDLFNFHNPACVMIRPDNFIGYCGVPIDVFSILKYLENNFISVDNKRLSEIGNKVYPYKIKLFDNFKDLATMTLFIGLSCCFISTLWSISKSFF